jgi:hypothetical protein
MVWMSFSVAYDSVAVMWVGFRLSAVAANRRIEPVADARGEWRRCRSMAQRQRAHAAATRGGAALRTTADMVLRPLSATPIIAAPVSPVHVSRPRQRVLSGPAPPSAEMGPFRYGLQARAAVNEKQILFSGPQARPPRPPSPTRATRCIVAPNSRAIRTHQLGNDPSQRGGLFRGRRLAPTMMNSCFTDGKGKSGRGCRR